MPILTYIDNIPLFTNKSEAISYGATSSPRMFGYHTHEYEGVTGYMAGKFHPANIRVKTKSSYEQYVSEANQAFNIISNRINNLNQEIKELEEALKVKKLQGVKRLNSIIRNKIKNINQSLNILNSEKNKIELDKKLAQKSTPEKLQELIDSERVDIDLLLKAQATIDTTIETIEQTQESNLVLGLNQPQQQTTTTQTTGGTYRSNY
tara:strand:+ start:803 stop:1423 length:621 start_codon:yes stop_codon:yes gene_type:complete